jgi:hypothetical protein
MMMNTREKDTMMKKERMMIIEESKEKRYPKMPRRRYRTQQRFVIERC